MYALAMSSLSKCSCFLSFICRGNESPSLFKAASNSPSFDSVNGKALAPYKEMMALPFVPIVFPSGPTRTKAGSPLMLKILHRSCRVLSKYGIASHGMLLRLRSNSLRSRSVEMKIISKQYCSLEVLISL